LSIFKIAFIGDVVGRPGRRALYLWLQENRKKIDLCIVNGENAAAGFGITEKIVKSFLAWGVDVITMGNHTWDKKDIFEFLDRYPVLRPMNYPEGTPGKGFISLKLDNNFSVTVLSLMGRVFMECMDNPFEKFDSLYFEMKDNFIVVDFHAEATSEKQAFSFHVDGRAGAVLGTHTHVRTDDLKVLSAGTLYMTDVGMCGAVESVIGMDVKESVKRFTKQLPVRFKIPEKPKEIQISGVLFEVDTVNRKVESFEKIKKVYIRGEDGNYS